MAEAPTPYFRGWAAAFKAAALARAGEAEAALPILEQVCALARASAHHGGYRYIALFLAEALRRTGRRDALRALLAELREATAEYPFARGECHRHFGETLLEEGEPARAAAEFRTAAAIFEEIGAANAASLAAYGLGRAQAALGDAAAARLALLAAQTGFARLGTLGMTDAVGAALAALA
jgi:hypothetical protein